MEWKPTKTAKRQTEHDRTSFSRLSFVYFNSTCSPGFLNAQLVVVLVPFDFF